MKRFLDGLLYAATILSGLGGITTILQFLGVTPASLRIAMPRSGWLVMSTLLFVVSLTTSTYAFIRSRRGGASQLSDLVPAAPEDALELISATPEIPEAQPPGIVLKWPRKLRVILRNRSAQQALLPDWISNRSTVPFQPPFWSLLRPEDKPAGGWKSGKWQKERPLINLEPGDVFEASVGLHEYFTVEEIRSRRITQRVGTLSLPVKINGQDMEWRVNL